MLQAAVLTLPLIRHRCKETAVRCTEVMQLLENAEDSTNKKVAKPAARLIKRLRQAKLWKVQCAIHSVQNDYGVDSAKRITIKIGHESAGHVLLQNLPGGANNPNNKTLSKTEWTSPTPLKSFYVVRGFDYFVKLNDENDLGP